MLIAVFAAAMALAPAGGDILIGMSAAFTGPSKGLGIELYRGVAACLEEVNRSGGIQGRRIALRAYDDGYNPTPAIENTIRLVENDQVPLLFGYVGTPTVTRILPLLRRYSDRNLYLFFPFTGAQPHRQPPYDDFVFNLRASYAQETAGLVDNFVRIGRRRIAVFYQADSYGRSGWDGVRKALARHGSKMSAEATYRRGTPYTQSLVEQVRILRAAGPDAIISVGAYAACAAFIRDARNDGWDVPVANVSFVGSENMLAQLAGTPGRDYTVNLINSQVVPSYEDLSLPAVRQYRQLMDRFNPAAPQLAEAGYKPMRYSFVSFEGFLNARVLAEILRRMPDASDRSRIRPAVESLKSLDIGIGTPVSFGPQRHQGLDRVYYTTVQGGRFVPIQDWSRWSR